MNSKVIVIDGKTYNSVNEMPEDIRRNYENAMRQSNRNSNNASNPLGFLDALADNNQTPNTLEGTSANVFSSSRIVVNGKVYNSIDELPPDIRAKYEQAMGAFKDGNQNKISDSFENMNILGDKNNNGMPDIFENIPAAQIRADNRKIVVNGQAFNGLDELPPDIRAKYEQTLGALDANKNGIPDFVEGMFGTPKQTDHAQVNYGIQSPRPASPKPMPVNSTIEPESSGGWMLAFMGILLLGLCIVAGAAGIWYFYLR